MQLEFTSELETGIGWQDREHKELFKRIKAVVDAAEHIEEANCSCDTAGSKDDACELLKLLDFLDDYVVEHFHDEEQAMSKGAYPDMLKHLEEHTIFIDEIGKVRTELESTGVTHALVEELHTQVADWFKNHIAETDKLLGAFLVRLASPTANI
jgi:hemerythrin